MELLRAFGRGPFCMCIARMAWAWVASAQGAFDRVCQFLSEEVRRAGGPERAGEGPGGKCD